MKHPYSGLPSHQFWKRAVSNVEPFMLDPVINPKFKIRDSDKISTAGSCFAQHISNHLKKIGFNYFVPEYDRTLRDDDARQMNYGIFSARYGNIYTSRQLLQLFQEVFFSKRRAEAFWKDKERFVDPMRPAIQPEGFSSPERIVEDRRKHLEYVRQVFTESSIFIFTLGLTEVWSHASSGDVYPLAPGVSGGEFCPDTYKFVNLTVSETAGDMMEFLAKLKEVNPSVKVILTVSPVPLIATYENRHVLVSTTYSKSVLRVAAQMAVDRFDWVDYFPSFEIITGHHHRGRYFGEDLREITTAGVHHAMSCFARHYLNNAESGESKPLIAEVNTPARIAPSMIVCDEEAIARYANE